MMEMWLEKVRVCKADGGEMDDADYIKAEFEAKQETCSE